MGSVASSVARHIQLRVPVPNQLRLAALNELSIPDRTDDMQAAFRTANPRTSAFHCLFLRLPCFLRTFPGICFSLKPWFWDERGSRCRLLRSINVLSHDILTLLSLRKLSKAINEKVPW